MCSAVTSSSSSSLGLVRSSVVKFCKVVVKSSQVGSCLVAVCR